MDNSIKLKKDIRENLLKYYVLVSRYRVTLKELYNSIKDCKKEFSSYTELKDVINSVSLEELEKMKLDDAILSNFIFKESLILRLASQNNCFFPFTKEEIVKEIDLIGYWNGSKFKLNHI